MRQSLPLEQASLLASAATSLKMENQDPFVRAKADVQELNEIKFNGQIKWEESLAILGIIKQPGRDLFSNLSWAVWLEGPM
jgi:hypothetical protein